MTPASANHPTSQPGHGPRHRSPHPITLGQVGVIVFAVFMFLLTRNAPASAFLLVVVPGLALYQATRGGHPVFTTWAPTVVACIAAVSMLGASTAAVSNDPDRASPPTLHAPGGEGGKGGTGGSGAYETVAPTEMTLDERLSAWNSRSEVIAYRKYMGIPLVDYTNEMILAESNRFTHDDIRVVGDIRLADGVVRDVASELYPSGIKESSLAYVQKGGKWLSGSPGDKVREYSGVVYTNDGQRSVRKVTFELYNGQNWLADVAPAP